MLLDICLGSKSAWRILFLYGESPGAGFTRQDLRKHTRLGNKALTFALKRLTSFGILTKSKGQFTLAVYKFNMENEYAKDILGLLKRERQDLNHLPNDFGAIAREVSRELLDYTNAKEIYLFGSVAKGTYRADSDMDFAAILDKKTPGQDMAINSICDRLSKRSKRKIQCFPISKDQFSRKSSGLAEEILKHGIRLV